MVCSITFVRLRPEIGDNNESKGHRQRKISREDGAARVRSEAPSWTLSSCAIRSLDAERTRVQASGDMYEKGGVQVLIRFIRATATSTSTRKERQFAWKKQDANCTGTVSTTARNV